MVCYKCFGDIPKFSWTRHIETSTKFLNRLWVSTRYFDIILSPECPSSVGRREDPVSPRYFRDALTRVMTSQTDLIDWSKDFVCLADRMGGGCGEIKICFASIQERKDFSMFRDQRSNLDCVYTQQKGLYTHKMMYDQRRKMRNTPQTGAPDPFSTGPRA